MPHKMNSWLSFCVLSCILLLRVSTSSPVDCPCDYHLNDQTNECEPNVCKCDKDCCLGAQCIVPRGGSDPMCVLPNDAVCPDCPPGNHYENGVCVPTNQCQTSADCCPEASCIHPRGFPNLLACVLPNDAICPSCPLGQHYRNGTCVPFDQCSSSADCCEGAQCIPPRGSQGLWLACVLPDDRICPACDCGQHYEGGKCQPNECDCDEDCCPEAQCIAPRGSSIKRCVLPNDALCFPSGRHLAKVNSQCNSASADSQGKDLCLQFSRSTATAACDA